jgi:uncharacterized protein YbcI
MHVEQRGLQTDGGAHGERGTTRAQTLASDDHGELLTAISTGLAGLLEEFYGPGLTEAKSYYEGDLVVCVLRGGFSRVEQTLLDAGRHELVTAQRMAFRELMLDRVIAVVEDATSQRVIGFMSGNQRSPDMMCEVFILAPADLFVPEDPSPRRPTLLTEVPGGDRGRPVVYRRGDHGPS